MKTVVTAVAVLFLGSAAWAQDQVKIDQAIHKGIEYLKGAGSPPHEHSKATHSDELLLYTFIIAEVSPANPRFKALLDRVLTDEPYQVYKVALQAMALEELDRVKYQNRIAFCAQHLIDNECTNGQWSYGTPTIAPKELPAGVASDGGAKDPKPVTGARDFGAGEKKPKPKVLRKLAIKKQRDGGGSGDNSNTQYAALGLRACYEAGIMIPEETIQLAVRWLIESAHAEEGGAAGKGAVVSGGETPGKPQGWAYKGATEGEPYGSMTAGATGALTIYDYMLKKDWKKNTTAKNGVAWLTTHYDIDSNPGKGAHWLYYYLYGLERVGVLYGTEKLGTHDWYQEGAKFLLEKQGANGAWNAEWDTCFAILFLKKATKPLVASTDGKR